MMNIAQAALGAALMLAAAPSIARDATTTVRIADLEPGSARDAAILRRRLAAAVERVCGSYASVDAAQMDSVTRCRRTAEAGVAGQVAAWRGVRQRELAGK